jgi:dimethylargininase
VPDSFAAAITGTPVDPPLSASLARQQHSAYVAALRDGGYRVVEIESDEAFPDCCFIEDTAVVVGTHALLTRAGHPSRRGEGEAVAPVLADAVRLYPVVAPATIDGGDVLVVGRRVFVGISGRTNRQGAEAMAAIAEPQGFVVTPVPVLSVLHLKSGLSALGDSTVIWHPRACDRADLVGVHVIEIGGDDPEAANVVRLADGRILVATHHRRTQALIAEAGFSTATVDVSEIARADGGLTCMSIRLR